jgi:CRP-like cAMP-binding protein
MQGSRSPLVAARTPVFASTPTTREETRKASSSPHESFAKAICAKLEYFNANDVALLTSKAKAMSYAPGDKLIKAGVPSPGFFMIRSGEVEVTRGETKLATLLAGDVCGEMSFLEGSSASASVIASKAATVEFLSAEELTGVFTAFPHLASRFYRSMALTLSRRLRTTSQQLCAVQGATQ